MANQIEIKVTYVDDVSTNAKHSEEALRSLGQAAQAVAGQTDQIQAAAGAVGNALAQSRGPAEAAAAAYGELKRSSDAAAKSLEALRAAQEAAASARQLATGAVRESMRPMGLTSAEMKRTTEATLAGRYTPIGPEAKAAVDQLRAAEDQLLVKQQAVAASFDTDAAAALRFADASRAAATAPQQMAQVATQVQQAGAGMQAASTAAGQLNSQMGALAQGMAAGGGASEQFARALRPEQVEEFNRRIGAARDAVAQLMQTTGGREIALDIRGAKTLEDLDKIEAKIKTAFSAAPVEGFAARTEQVMAQIQAASQIKTKDVTLAIRDVNAAQTIQQLDAVSARVRFLQQQAELLGIAGGKGFEQFRAQINAAKTVGELDQIAAKMKQVGAATQQASQQAASSGGGPGAAISKWIAGLKSGEGVAALAGNALGSAIGFGLFTAVTNGLRMATTAITGFLHDIDTYANQMRSMKFEAASLGFTTNQLQTLEFAAKRTGVSIGSLNFGMKMLAQSATQNSETFKALGIDVHGTETAYKSTWQLMTELADVFANTRDSTLKMALAADIFGRSGTRLIPFLELGSAGIKEMQEEAKKFGYVLAEGDQKQFRAYANALALTDLRIEGAKRQWELALIPMKQFGAELVGQLAPGLRAAGMYARLQVALAGYTAQVIAYNAARTMGIAGSFAPPTPPSVFGEDAQKEEADRTKKYMDEQVKAALEASKKMEGAQATTAASKLIDQINRPQFSTEAWDRLAAGFERTTQFVENLKFALGLTDAEVAKLAQRQVDMQGFSAAFGASWRAVEAAFGEAAHGAGILEERIKAVRTAMVTFDIGEPFKGFKQQVDEAAYAIAHAKDQAAEFVAQVDVVIKTHPQNVEEFIKALRDAVKGAKDKAQEAADREALALQIEVPLGKGTSIFTDLDKHLNDTQGAIDEVARHMNMLNFGEVVQGYNDAVRRIAQLKPKDIAIQTEVYLKLNPHVDRQKFNDDIEKERAATVLAAQQRQKMAAEIETRFGPGTSVFTDLTRTANDSAEAMREVQRAVNEINFGEVVQGYHAMLRELSGMNAQQMAPRIKTYLAEHPEIDRAQFLADLKKQTDDAVEEARRNAIIAKYHIKIPIAAEVEKQEELIQLLHESTSVGDQLKANIMEMGDPVRLAVAMAETIAQAATQAVSTLMDQLFHKTQAIGTTISQILREIMRQLAEAIVRAFILSRISNFVAAGLTGGGSVAAGAGGAGATTGAVAGLGGVTTGITIPTVGLPGGGGYAQEPAQEPAAGSQEMTAAIRELSDAAEDLGRTVKAIPAPAGPAAQAPMRPVEAPAAAPGRPAMVELPRPLLRALATLLPAPAPIPAATRPAAGPARVEPPRPPAAPAPPRIAEAPKPPALSPALVRALEDTAKRPEPPVRLAAPTPPMPAQPDAMAAAKRLAAIMTDFTRTNRNLLALTARQTRPAREPMPIPARTIYATPPPPPQTPPREPAKQTTVTVNQTFQSLDIRTQLDQIRSPFGGTRMATESDIEAGLI